MFIKPLNIQLAALPNYTYNPGKACLLYAHNGLAAYFIKILCYATYRV